MIRNKIIKESCVDSVDQAVSAEKNGADRIELCKNLDLDGLTPDVNVIVNTVKSVNIPIKVMIRPRPGNFVYSQNEIKIMEDDIDLCKRCNVSEVVFGILTPESKIDIEKTKKLASKAYPLPITFHKAIDQTKDMFLELEKLSNVSQICNVLTSGGQETAIKGRTILKKIISEYGERFGIIIAGSVSYKNFDEVHRLINAKEYHGKNLISLVMNY